MNVLDLAADLTPEETRDLLKRLAEKRGLAEPTDDPGEAAIRQEAEEKVKAYRQQKDLAPLIESYKREMLSARGKGRIVGDRIKAKYRAQGVPVETIQFSV